MVDSLESILMCPEKKEKENKNSTSFVAYYNSNIYNYNNIIIYMLAGERSLCNHNLILSKPQECMKQVFCLIFDKQHTLHI